MKLTTEERIIYRKAVTAYRRRYAIGKWERNCRLVEYRGRHVKAWTVPGTPEAGEHAMNQRYQHDAGLRAVEKHRTEANHAGN